MLNCYHVGHIKCSITNKFDSGWDLKIGQTLTATTHHMRTSMHSAKSQNATSLSIVPAPVQVCLACHSLSRYGCYTEKWGLDCGDVSNERGRMAC